MTLTLSHPGKFNAMSRAMWRELKVVFNAIQADPEARCVLLRGEGGHFCAGGDIAEYPSFRFNEAALRQFHEDEVWGGLQAMLDCDVPIVAQIEGNCMGAGVEIASCCDLRVAGASARFGAPIARLGFPMAPREAALVAQAAGNTVARAMLLAAEVFDAPAMLARGFLLQVPDDAEMAGHCEALARRVAGLAPQAARMNKQTLRAIQAQNRPLAPVNIAPEAPDSIASLTTSAYTYADSAEHREGIAAFLAKRQPQF
ncbi:enoyl-CoA hydratase/carnithine racemase [Rhodoferax saidenbachensis]|uniref:Enoyl-CoA hydratase/carnithine racemase n=1 Tax=Rhodoferax saidenbachensis TaxID=1484693 RepID=A0ABU1ZSF5_9BURK|nr:enoyl-CoA hydratase/carnithine racemase [Rhodoferax saidenbachensis]